MHRCRTGRLCRLLLCAVCSGCCARAPIARPAALCGTGAPQSVPAGRWYRTSAPPRGVVLALHGLNNRPEVMEPLIGELTLSGFHVLLVPPASAGGHLAARWLEQIETAYCRAAQAYPGAELSALGYSTGGALIAAFMAAHPQHRLVRVVLLAPALSLTRKSIMIRLLTPLRFVGLALPSLAPKEYRAAAFTPLSAYHALFELSDGLQKTADTTGLNRAQGLVILNPEDELVDYRGVRRWLEAHAPAWRVTALHSQGRAHWAHLIITPAALGESAWHGMADGIAAFLQGRSRG